ncbi:MAG: GNAT family N-acetyltransferase [Candidatus Delongbacteria bacterium]
MSWTWTELPLPLGEEAARAWERLTEQAPHPHIQSTAWWMEAWVRQFAPQQSRLLAFQQGGEWRALLPVVRRRERDPHCPLAHRVLCNGGDGFSDSLPLAVAPGDQAALEQVAAWLERAGRHVHEARLAPLIEGTPAFPLAELLEARGWECGRVEGNPLLDLRAGWEALEARVGKNLRHDVAKKKRRLAEAGLEPELQLEQTCTPALLEELRELARRRWQSEGHKSSFLDPARCAFIGTVGTLATERGEFACFCARRSGRLVAYRLGFLHGGAFFDWITSYDPELFPYSIGKLVLWDSIRQLGALGVERLDFMAGEEDYKLKWDPVVRPMLRCRRLRPGPVNLLRAGVRAASRWKSTWRT